MAAPMPQPIAHALELPEIVFKIAQYLDAADVLACSSVSTSFYTSFTPFVWRDLHFGQPCKIDPDKEPFARSISFNRIRKGTEPQDPGIVEQRLLELYQRNASFIRSLSIHSHDSIHSLNPGRGATQIQSIKMAGLLLDNENHTVEHWKNCKKIFSHSQSSLQSVSLINWKYDLKTKHQKKQPIWNPILRCVYASNLRSLSLMKCWIRGRHMKAFRTVCERLEKLELREVMIDLSMPTTISSKEKNSDGKAEENNESDVSHASSSRFPRLKELRLELSWPSSPRQLNLIIAQCPMLQTLVWETTRWGLYVRRRFCELYVSSTWPYLDSITIAGYGTYINEEDHIRILKAAKLPLRRLEFNTGCTLPETFDLYRSHFSTIQTMDLTFSLSSHSGARTVEILTSCPSLEIIKSHIITAQEIFNAGPWVCRNLQVFSVCIDMAFPNNAENRRFSPEEIEQCRIVYKQLAALKQLRELNSLVPYRNVIHVYLLPRQHPVQLPLRLKAGLDLMASSTKLESVHFWGGKRVVHMKELKWMVEHWKRLKHIQGQWRTGSPVVKDKYLRFGKLVDWLRERGIKTDGSHHECYTNGGPEDVEYEDCCSSSEDEDETEASFLANKE